MAEVNKVWMSVDSGSYSQGQKVSFFAGGDDASTVLATMGEVFGTEATDQAIGRLQNILAVDPVAAAAANVKAGGLVGGDGAPDASSSSTPVCNHGAMVFKNGVSAKGPWRAWMCPQPKDAPNRCSPQWLK